jgi:hypothetical protein
MKSSDSPLGRRAALAVLGGSLIALALAACAGAGGNPTYRGGRRRHDDDVPFWLRQEQRD